MRTFTHTDAVAFITAHPFIKMEAVCKSIGINPKTLTRAVNGFDQFPCKHLPALLKALKKYDGGRTLRKFLILP